MLAYNKGDLQGSVNLALQAKQMTSRAMNKGVLIAESNTQLAAPYRQERMFGCAEDLMAEAFQVEL